MIKNLIQTILGKTGYCLTSTRRFGWEQWQDIASFLKDRTSLVVFDVGAHHGETLREIADYFPTSRIYCFEPDPDSFAALKNVAKSINNSEIHQLAMGNEVGSLDFYRNAESMTNSLLQTSAAAKESDMAPLMKNIDKVQVSVTTLDDFCKNSGIAHIDFLKIDCQGYDLKVLKGAEDLLAKKNIDVIECEAIFDPEYIDQGWFHEILGYLNEKGYALCAIHHAARNGHQEITFANALFRIRA